MKQTLFQAYLYSTLYLIVFCTGCQQTTEQEAAKTQVIAESSPEWSNLLLNKKGWIGADGIYCVPLNGVERPGEAQQTKTLFWFSDTIIGDIEDDSLQQGWEMVHNSIAYLTGGDPDKEKMDFFWAKDDDGKARSVFEPHTPEAQVNEYYWLGDGFFNHRLDSTIYIFAYRIRNLPEGAFPFEDVGVNLIAIPKGSQPPFNEQRQMDTPLFHIGKKGKSVFGINVLANTTGAGAPQPDGYIYVYGIRGTNKELLVARVEEELFEDFQAWTYWDGQSWNSSIDESAAITDRISNEMSVSFMEDGRVIAAFQVDTNSPSIAIQVAKTPIGPFFPFKKVYETPEIYEDIDFYTYNAKAHPHLSTPGELLISYNVNAFDFENKLYQHPNHCRPRFIRVKY
ncbi:DUF4185 domain-containing protein [Olivibacter sp. SDN3]|uniref:DUF4185 domain-containing protein n=1 Tax=Olivibacter sp. SDN3 TaxID=2764720 RepID=UPI0016510278|nr:DUF4185 domain-containing protein [Olivibacter sp. SDN3]QNL51739.1 DUF4185 domain-containing protein [Olivibacter sp. SDN3]